MSIKRLTQHWYKEDRFILYDDQNAASVECYTDDEYDELHISSLYVEEMNRGKGVGRNLFQEAEHIALQEGIYKTTICLWDKEVEDWAFQWFKRLGYETYHEDDGLFFMSKNLK